MRKEYVKKRFMYSFVWISFLLIFFSNYVEPAEMCLSLQRARGEIRGTVTDEEGNPLPGVTVEAIGLAGRATAITSADGCFRIVDLYPGTYNIKAELTGFKTKEISNIYVSIGRPVSLDIRIEMGDIDETGGIVKPIMPTIQPVRPPITTEKGTTPPPPSIPKATLNENQGLNPFSETYRPEIVVQCYYSGGKIHAKNGIAMVGRNEERLNNITQIPYGDEKYTNKSLKVESGCVYAVRIIKLNEMKTLLIRVLDLLEDKIEIEYWIQNGR